MQVSTSFWQSCSLHQLMRTHTTTPCERSRRKIGSFMTPHIYSTPQNLKIDVCTNVTLYSQPDTSLIRLPSDTDKIDRLSRGHASNASLGITLPHAPYIPITVSSSQWALSFGHCFRASRSIPRSFLASTGATAYFGSIRTHVVHMSRRDGLVHWPD